jgi:hypothetical protein
MIFIMEIIKTIQIANKILESTLKNKANRFDCLVVYLANSIILSTVVLLSTPKPSC